VDSTVSTPHGEVLIRRYQIMVWISLAVDSSFSRSIPAIIDTGLNHNFALNESHLAWANLRLEQLSKIGTTKIEGESIPVRKAEVHLHHNTRGTKLIAASEPYHLKASQGIIVFPAVNKYPRVPILGIRCLVNSNLRLIVDGKRKTVSLRSDWCW